MRHPKEHRDPEATREETTPLPEDAQQQVSENVLPEEEQQEGTAPPDLGLPPLDERDLCWLQLLAFLLSQQADSREDIPSIESAPDEDAAMREDDPLEQDMAASGLLKPRPFTQRHPRHLPRWLSLALGLVSVGMLLLLGFSLAVSLLSPSATVTIIPEAVTLSSSTTVRVVTSGTADPSRHQISGRLLSSLMLSQATTIPTTGLGHQAAQAAHGLVTFYNALPAEQTIPAGTLLVGADGVQVVTEQEAILPAGTLSSNGQARVVAHAVEMGPAGNIAARDLYGPCCRQDVFVQNTATFTGGQDARTFRVVSQHDLDETASFLKAALTQSVQAVFAAQLRVGEVLLTPVPCHSVVTRDHQTGEEAIQVRVTLSETCADIAFPQDALQAQVTDTLNQQATSHLGTGYALSGEVQVSLLRMESRQGTAILTVRGTGVWVAQFSPDELEAFAQQIAGKSRGQATALLLQQAGVGQVALHLSGAETTTLPTDAAHIHLVVLSGWEVQP